MKKNIAFDAAYAGTMVAMELIQSSLSVEQLRTKLFEVMLITLRSAEHQRRKRERKRHFRQLRPSDN